MRAAIYARYSTDKQSDNSIPDQLRAARQYAERQGWSVVSEHADEGVSGAIPVALRQGGKELLAGLMAKRFDVLIMEGLERLSREISEAETIVKRLEHRGVRIVGLSDGYDTQTKGRKVMRIARGLVNELYLDDVREKTHRGLTGQMARGLSAGGLTYGYDTEATPLGRRMVINEAQAQHVRWIFEQIAGGRTARSVAHQLNQQGVPSARGGTWAVSAIFGNKAKGLGMVNNQLYIGKVIWNRTQWIKEPETGRRVRIDRPEREWITRHDDGLRIVSQDLWDRVQRRITGDGLHAPKKGRGGGINKTLFGGLLRCGTCSGAIIAINAQRYGCSVHKDRGASVCASARTVAREVVDRRLLAVVRDELLSPGALATLQLEVRAILAEHNKAARADGQDARKRLAELDTQLARLIEAVATVGISPTLAQAIQAAEAEKRQLEQQAAAQPPVDTKLIIDDVVARYKRMMLRLQTILDDEDRASTRQMLADLLGTMTLETEKDGSMAVLLEEPAERLMMSAVGESLGLVAGARNYSRRRIPL